VNPAEIIDEYLTETMKRLNQFPLYYCNFCLAWKWK